MHDMATRKASFSEVLKLAAPIIISMISMSVLGLVDTFFMGWVGPEAQAAVGTGAPAVFCLISLFFGSCSGLTTFVSQFFGAGNYKSCGGMLWHVLFFALTAGILCTAVLPYATVWMLNIAHVNPEIMQDTIDYMTVRIYAAPWVFISFSLLSFLRGLGDMKTPAIVSAIAVLINIPLTYAFAFGWWFIPAYGVTGAAIGTIISQGIEMILYACAVFSHKNAQKFCTRSIVRPKLQTYLNFFKVSLPIGLSWTLENTAWLIAGLYIASLTKEESAANAIVQSFMNLAFMPGLAISIAATTLVGQYMGAQNIKSAERSTHYSIALSIAFLMSFGFIIFLLRTNISELYSENAQVVAVAANLFIFCAVYQIFDAIGVTTAGALRGAGDTRFPMIIQLVAMWIIMIPLIFILGNQFNIYGVYAATTLSVIIMDIGYYARFKIGRWKTMGLIQKNTSEPHNSTISPAENLAEADEELNSHTI